MRLEIRCALLLAVSLLPVSVLAGAGSVPDTAAGAGLVDVAGLAPDITVDMRYLGSNNFTGAPVPGYQANRCYLRAPAAQALARVQQAVAQQGYRLQVFDCYRPVRAVQAFVRWAHAPADPAAKAAYFPQIDKPDLLNGYISATSGHSLGHTVDLTLLDCRSGACQPLDMGTPFDFFDPRANLGHPAVTPAQVANRNLLQQAMQAQGFEPYAMEWWHFSHPEQRSVATRLDVPVH